MLLTQRSKRSTIVNEAEAAFFTKRTTPSMKLTEYIKETRSEMAHVSWPTRRQAVVYSVIVIAISIIVGVLLGVFDSAFALAMKYLFVQ